MADPQQLINQANSGQLSYSDFIRNKYSGGGPPKITDPVAPPVQTTGDGFSDFYKNKYGAPQQPVVASQPQQSGLPVAETIPASPEVLQKPSVWRDFFAPSLKDAADMAINSALPAAMTIAGGAAGSLIPGAGTVAGATLGAAAGGAAGTYLNELFGIDDSTAVDYALNAGLPLAGGVVSKAGRAILKRMPSFQSAQKAAGVKLGKGLTDMVLDKPEKKLVDAAWQSLDNMGAAYPTATVQQNLISNTSESTQKFITKQLKKSSDELAEIVADPLRVQMTPSELQKYNSVLKSTRDDLLRRGNPGDGERAKQIKSVIDATNKQIDSLAAAGDQGALAIKKANELTRQVKTFDDIDELLQESIKTKVVQGQLEESINVAQVWDRVNKIERLVNKGRHSTDALTKGVQSLMEHPEAFKQFKAGLQRIAKLTPDGNIRLIGEHGGGVLERAARMASQEVSTGALARMLGTNMGQDIMERTLRESGGKMTVPMLATMFTTIRPILSGIAPEADPMMQQMSQTIQESVGLSKRASEQLNQVNQ